MRSLAAVLLLALVAASQGVASTAQIVSQVSQDSYYHFLNDRLYTASGDSRALGGPQHDLAKANIYSDFLGMGLDTHYADFSYNSQTYQNVVATLPGRVRSNDVYIVGAHYDSTSGGGAAPGADDNASGVAGMLEAARVLSGYAFESTVVFIAFDREEQGLRGSWAYANAHAGDRILGMISLDMIGYNSTTNSNTAWVVSQSSSFRQELMAAVTAYGKTPGGPALTPVDMGTNYDSQSDHYPFERNQFLGALLIEHGPMNPYYHTSSDVASYIDYTYAANMTRAAVGFLADNAEEVPEPAAASLVAMAAVFFLMARRRSVFRPASVSGRAPC